MVKLPEAVARLLEAVEELKKRYEKYGRKFTLDGHLVGEIGEVVATEELGLKLHPPGHANMMRTIARENRFRSR